jgi:DNA relaxase NicK
LSLRPWESFVADGLLFGYRTVRRVMSSGSRRDGNTVYLGCRESDKFMRIYDKTIDGFDFDRLEIELKRNPAKSVMYDLVS